MAVGGVVVTSGAGGYNGKRLASASTGRLCRTFVEGCRRAVRRINGRVSTYLRRAFRSHASSAVSSGRRYFSRSTTCRGCSINRFRPVSEVRGRHTRRCINGFVTGTNFATECNERINVDRSVRRHIAGFIDVMNGKGVSVTDCISGVVGRRFGTCTTRVGTTFSRNLGSCHL